MYITYANIVDKNGNVTTFQGDDYDNADGRALEWINTAGTWPDLTNATIAIAIEGIGNFAGSVIVPTGVGQKVRLELTGTETRTIPPSKNTDDYHFEVRAIQSVALGGDVITLVEGIWTSRKRY